MAVCFEDPVLTIQANEIFNAVCGDAKDPDKPRVITTTSVIQWLLDEEQPKTTIGAVLVGALTVNTCHECW